MKAARHNSAGRIITKAVSNGLCGAGLTPSPSERLPETHSLEKERLSIFKTPGQESKQLRGLSATACRPLQESAEPVNIRGSKRGRRKKKRKQEVQGQTDRRQERQAPYCSKNGAPKATCPGRQSAKLTHSKGCWGLLQVPRQATENVLPALEAGGS
eukprot:1148469-Pelagomonas_calceolata.AAC.1